MKKWYLMEITRGDWFEEPLRATTRKQALEEARRHYQHLGSYDQKRLTDFYACLVDLDEDGTVDLDSMDDKITREEIEREETDIQVTLQFDCGEGRHFRGSVHTLSDFDTGRMLIYAECPIPDGASDDYGYLTMKRAILRAVEKRGIKVELEFWYDGQEEGLANDANADCEVYVEINADKQ